MKNEQPKTADRTCIKNSLVSVLKPKIKHALLHTHFSGTLFKYIFQFLGLHIRGLAGSEFSMHKVCIYWLRDYL